MARQQKRPDIRTQNVVRDLEKPGTFLYHLITPHDVVNAGGLVNSAETELTIATGVITITQLRHTVDTASDDPSDDLDTINGGSATLGAVVLRAEHTDRTIVVKHNTGNIWLRGQADVSLDDIEDGILLFWDAENSKWFGVSVGPHSLLDGSIHGDSVADAVTRGSIVYGNATPKWDELVLGAANTFLGSDGTDLSYRTAAQVWASLSGAAAAAVDMNGQNITNVGTVDGVDVSAHKDRHDPDDGADPLDAAAPAEIAGVQAAGEGSSHSFARADHAHQIQESMADNHLVTINQADVATNDMARFSATGGLEGVSYAELLAALSGDAGAAFDWNDQILQKIKGMLFTTATELTIDASGVITATQMVHTVDTAGDAASDNLDTINGGTTVGLIIIRPAHTDRTVVVRDGQGNIELQGGSDISLDDITDHMMLFWDTTNSKWVDFGGGGAGGAAHAILDGSTHSDSVADAVTEGSLILGNATPKWDELVIGAAGTTLISNGTTASWSAARATVSTANTTVYVDAAAVGAGDGTSWGDAFTTIQAAWDSLPTIVAHAYIIKIRKGAAAYAELVSVTSKYIVGTVSIEGEFFIYGDCEAHALGVGEIKDTGAFGSVAVGDKVYAYDLGGASGHMQNYQICTVDDIANAPDQIGTDSAVNINTANWDYVIVRTQVTGSSARAYCFNCVSLDNITIQGLYMTASDSYGVRINNCRVMTLRYLIFEDTARGVSWGELSSGSLTYCAIDVDGALPVIVDTSSAINLYYTALDSIAGQSALLVQTGGSVYTIALHFANCVAAVVAYNWSFIRISAYIMNTCTTGLYAADMGVIEVLNVINNAGTAETPSASPADLGAHGTDGYID